jgi:hypothetical protein
MVDAIQNWLMADQGGERMAHGGELRGTRA